MKIGYDILANKILRTKLEAHWRRRVFWRRIKSWFGF
jgi:hypothetical protein